MPLGQAMFGKQMLDIPAFWKTDQRTGKLIKHEIDYKKLNTDKTHELMKRWVLTFVAGQILEHRSLQPWATGIRYDFTYYDDIIGALSKIPGDILYDQTSMKRTDIPAYFFSKEQIAWLRKISGTGRFKLYSLAFLQEIFLGKRGSKEEMGLTALMEAIAMFARASTQSIEGAA